MPGNAYITFCSKERPKVMKEHPGWKLPQVSKELGARWNALSDAQKLKYKAK